MKMKIIILISLNSNTATAENSSQQLHQPPLRPQTYTPTPKHSPKNTQAKHPPKYISYNSSPVTFLTNQQSAPFPLHQHITILYSRWICLGII